MAFTARAKKFLTADSHLFAIDEVSTVNLDNLRAGKVVVTLKNGQILVATDFDAFEIVMSLNISAIEGRRLKHVKHAWAIHNLIGHPLMQIFAWCGLHSWAIFIHDVTTPKIIK